MKTFKARGIVLREYEAGESDKRLVMLCKEHGKMLVYARGARKPKSKFMAAAQLFTYGDFIIGEGPHFKSMNQAEIIENFYHIRADYERLCHAHWIMELCEKTTMEHTECDALLLLLLKTLSHLNKPANAALPALHISCVFLFRFFLQYGLAPQADLCCVCDEEPLPSLPSGHLFFCDEGVVCPACARMEHKAISPGALHALRWILNNNLPNAFLFNASEPVQRELMQAGRLFWNSHFQWKLQSEAFL